ncbi:MAG: PqqD family protein [Rhodocyclaceae bacterium]|jgi:hypothetical protein|nr:PqqD family protein [Rhodocyclaceae bacterium]MCZ8195434.1 PqqD family peptide modification chaperone [Aquidulcibacter sp.]
MTENLGKPIYVRANVQGSMLGDEIVFFDERAGKYFATGSVGADIWNLLVDPMDIDGICAALMEAYEVDHETCYGQVIHFLKKMEEANLIVLRSTV